MNISIVCCTWNNANRLRITLDSLCSVSVPKHLNWELVLVNNNCTDVTDGVVAEFKERLPIKYIYQPRQGKSYALNSGIQSAIGEFVIFIDDDIRFSEGWLEAYLNAFRARPKGFFFGGPIESEFETKAPPSEVLGFFPGSVKGYDLGEQEKIVTDEELFLGANWGCLKAYIERVGYFDIKIGLGSDAKIVVVGEETDLMTRLKAAGLEGCYLPKAKIYHFVPQSKCSIRHAIKRRRGGGYCNAVLDFEKRHQFVLIFNYPRWACRIFFEKIVSFICSLYSKSRRRQALYEISYWVGYFYGWSAMLAKRARD